MDVRRGRRRAARRCRLVENAWVNLGGSDTRRSGGIPSKQAVFVGPNPG